MKLKTKIWLFLGGIMGVLLVTDLSISYHRLSRELRKEMEVDARAIYGYMMATRRVYQQVFVSSGLPLDERTVGFLPAYSFSRISRDFANWNDSGLIFNNVSDQPRNPRNRADRFEQEDMAWFRGNKRAKERTRNIIDDKGVGYLLYTAPIWVESFCLRCHGSSEEAPPSVREKYATAYGYRIGDLRGLVSVKIPLKRFEARLNSIWMGQLIKSVVSYLILFVVLGMLLEHLILRRLERLRQGTVKIAAGDYATRVPEEGRDELCSLAQTFNRMADAVQLRDQALLTEIGEKERGVREIHRLAYYDGLTGLPNRTLLMDRLTQLLAARRRTGQKEALLLLNIDRFKTINDARGHVFGDMLLKSLSDRLTTLVWEGDTLARLAADEFAFLLSNLSLDTAQASRRVLVVAEKIHALLSKPLWVDHEEIAVTVSLGIALFSEEISESPNDILRRADTALHRAKAGGGHQSAFFETSMGEVAEQRFHIERELRHALASGELRLFLQPQLDASEVVVGAEVLVRWQHPERGLLPPGTFIPIAEESDLIVDLGEWVMRETCRLLAREDMAGRPLHLSVNLSPRHFRRGEFVSWVRELLRATGADPSHLTLEVTEGLVIDNLAEVAVKMDELVALGIHFSVDDFGTGYSSLAYLKRLPIHELKIDKTFVQDAPDDPDDAALVETILAVARHMHLKVVAEGVETEVQAAFLKARASVIFQGYLYGRPEPAEVWIARWRECEKNAAAT